MTSSSKPRIMIGAIDITDYVAKMYDALINSMDWGSDFLDWEEVQAILLVGKAAGFDPLPHDEAKLPSPRHHKQLGVNIERPEYPSVEERMSGANWIKSWEERRKEWAAQVGAAIDAQMQGLLDELPVDEQLCERVGTELLSKVTTPAK